MNIQQLASTVISDAGSTKRHIVAIAGPPAAGKTTLAEQLGSMISSMGHGCAVVPMDGFHLDNRVLIEKGLLDRKGAPNTFDADGFVQLIVRIAQCDHRVYYPVFDRQRDIAIAGAAYLDTDCKIIIVEGNYLLLDDDPWRHLSKHWNTTVFVKPDMALIEQRLLDRWLHHGLDHAAAKTRAHSNDIPNAMTVIDASNLKQVDITITQPWDQSP